jgi:hypothetical protein
VMLDGAWGSICDTSWNISAADIVCRHLGFPGAVAAIVDSAFRNVDTLPVAMSQFRCPPDANIGLLSCSFYRWNQAWCPRGQEAGVVCRTDDLEDLPNDNSTVRLEGGESIYGGRVEMKIGDEWGIVCHDGWDDNDAYVACRQSGYSGMHAVLRGSMFGEMPGLPIWMTDLECSNEDTLQKCHRTPSPPAWGLSSCYDNETAAVVCESSASTGSTTTETIRLSGHMNSLRAGRLEVFFSTYISVRHDNFPDIAKPVP